MLFFKKKIENYEIVYDKNIGIVWKEVNNLLEKGWEPQGGLAIQQIGNNPETKYFYQAMVKRG